MRATLSVCEYQRVAVGHPDGSHIRCSAKHATLVPGVSQSCEL